MTSIAIHGQSAFKVPLPRKPVESDCKEEFGGKSVIFDNRFLYLVQKLYKSPSSLTGYDLMLLRRHPVIGQLIDLAARNSLPISSFYVPIESILRPYASERVQIYYRQKIIAGKLNPPVQNCTVIFFQKTFPNSNLNYLVVHENQKVDEEDAEVFETTAETTEHEQKVGFYTKKERLEKIKRFKEKKIRALANKLNSSVKYLNKSRAAKERIRVNGKFVKA